MPCTHFAGRVCLIRFIPLLLLMVGAGCSSSRGSVEEDADMNARAAQVVAAVRFAYGLEKELLDHAGDFETRAQVYAHFRQGFSDDLATRLTGYAWGDGKPRAGPFATQPPDTVHVLTLGNTTATVYYATPPLLREAWVSEPYMLDELRREPDGRWVIVASKGITEAPEGR